MTETITPLFDKLIVERQPRAEKTAGGLYLPNDIDGDTTTQGRVLSVGPGVTNEKTGVITEIDVKVGDVVLFHNNAGIKVSGYKETPERVMLREEDVLAIVV